jgi:hypothetical protein
LIRIDFGGSGCSTPRRITVEAPDIVTDIFSRKDDVPKPADHPFSFRPREDARRLEQKVARIAAQKSSVEEVSLLHQELQAWLSVDVHQDSQASTLFNMCLSSPSLNQRSFQSSGLQLSAALLRAILVNHVSHSEATKAAKNAELALKESLEQLEASNNRLESELRR